MARTRGVTARAGAEKVNSPRSFVGAVLEVPTIDTAAPATGPPLSALVTRPVMVRCWAQPSATPAQASRADTRRLLRGTTVPPSRVSRFSPELEKVLLRCTAFREAARGASPWWRPAPEPCAGR